MNGWDIINGLKSKHCDRIAGIVGPGLAAMVAANIEHHVGELGLITSEEELSEIVEDSDMAHDLVEWAEEEAAELSRQRLERTLSRFNQRTYTRSRYLPTSTLVNYTDPNGNRRWKFEREVRGMGLMQAFIEHVNKKPGLQPVAIPLLNVFNPETDDPALKNLPDAEIENLYKNGLITSQGRWGWNRVKPATVSIWATDQLAKMFPNAVDATAYNHGLNAPTVPGGIWLDEPVRFTTIKTILSLNAGCDGSGRIHPRLLDRLETGVCTVQFRLMTEGGTFAKGILVPDERCVRWEKENNSDYEFIVERTVELTKTITDLGEARREALKELMVKKGAVDWRFNDEAKAYYFAYPETWIDWAQVKGAKKETAKKFLESGREHVTNAHIGIIQVWNRPGAIDWCFEILENIQDTPENWKTIKGFLAKAYKDLTRQGVDGLAMRVAKDSPTAALAVRFIAMLNAHHKRLGTGKQFSPLAIPWLRDAVEDRLSRILWHMAQGAGKSSPRYVAVIDNGIEPGKVVLKGPGMHPGTKVALFRFPVVLAQVLNTCVVTEPLPHHIVDGDIVPYTIFMNARDITSCLMGDDDGDVVGVSNDPKVVKLFESKVDNKIYLIEPKGVKINKPIFSEEGIAYMARDQRGDVGRLTIMRSKLLAVNDIMGANAISILIQEAIDKAKKAVEWTDWRLAVDEENWEETEGMLRFMKSSATDFIDHNGKKIHVRHQAPTRQGHVDMKIVSMWVNKRLEDRGVPLQEDETGKTSPVPVLGWRLGGQNKRISTSEWFTAEFYQGGFQGGNLVHKCFNEALKLWTAVEEKFILSFQHIELATVVHDLLKLHGHEVPIQEMDWTDYERGLRKSSGVQELGAAFRDAKQTKDEDARYNKFDQALDAFERKAKKLSTQELAQIWYMECKYSRLDNPDNPGNINYAYYAISWQGSPILRLLGMEFRHTCEFLDQHKGVEPYVIRECMASPNPIEKLTELIRNNTTHAKYVKGEDGLPIQAWECPDCTAELQKGVVNAIRRDKTHGSHEFIKNMVTNLNR